MQSDRFEVPVTVRQGATGNLLILKTPREASDFLLNNWPGKKSLKHRAALQACHDAQAGDKPVWQLVVLLLPLPARRMC